MIARIAIFREAMLAKVHEMRKQEERDKFHNVFNKQTTRKALAQTLASKEMRLYSAFGDCIITVVPVDGASGKL